MTRIALVAAALLMLPLLSGPLLAQDRPDPPVEKKGENKEPVLSPAELAKRQKEVGERLKKLEDVMNRIAERMAVTDPDKAARLRLAWQRSRDDRNLEVIQEIENLLRVENFNEAFEQQKSLETALNRLLDILLDRDADRKDLEEKIDRYERMVDQIAKLIEQERDHQLKTEKFADPEKTLQRAAAAKAKLADLIARQSKLKDKTAAESSGKPAMGDLGARISDLQQKQRDLRGQKDPDKQDALAKEAKEIADELAKRSENLPDEMKGGAMGQRNPAEQAAKAMQRAADGMQQASKGMQSGQEGENGFQNSQSGAEQDLREAAEALKRLGEREQRHEQAKLAKEQERLRRDTERLREELDRLERSAPGNDSGSGNLGKAEQKMGGAKKELDKGRRKQALPDQQEAKEELERAYKKLEEFEKELKKLTKLPDYEKLAKEQDSTTENTEDLLKRMDKESSNNNNQDGENAEGNPAQNGVKQAKKAMQRASKNLRKKSAKGANSDQKEAIERLEKAKEELEEALRQLREEEQLMLLDALERRLIQMLQKQTGIYKETISLSLRIEDAAKANRKPARADVDKSRQLGDGEAELAAEAEKIIEILREEGTTVVIPDVIEDLKADLDGLARRLRELKAGTYTQDVQREVIQTLRELIQVVQEELDRRQGGQQGGQGQEPMEGDQEDNLLPTSAELKMLKSLQIRVNRRTTDFDRMKEKEEVEQKRLAEKQASAARLTKSMADKLNREEE